MKILTIAREIGSIPTAQEQQLCQALGLKLIQKQNLEERFQQLGADGSFMKRFDEKKPRIIDALLNRSEVYCELLKSAIIDSVSGGDCAVIGRGANFLLENIASLRIKLTAPVSYRVQNLIDEYQCSASQADDIIKKVDQEREGFCHYYYNRNWRDITSYDMVINCAEINFELLKEILASVLDKRSCDSRRDSALKDLITAQKVRYEILIKESLEIRLPEIKVSDGILTLRGIVPSSAMEARIIATAEKYVPKEKIVNSLQIMLKDIPKRRV